MPFARLPASVSGRSVGAVVAVVWFVGVLTIGPQGDLTAPASRMLAIFGAAVALWISEAVPLAATSVFVILATVLLVSDQALVGLPSGFDPPSYESVFATLANPVLILFLGGFVLADSATKYGLDKNLAGYLLRPFGTAPRSILAGLMAITAVLSMFVSNTATTAAMMAVVLPVAAGLGRDDRFRVALVLSVPVAANVGGIGTPVGSPPNAIVLGRLAEQGVRVDFLRWMLFGVPVAVVVLVVAWAVLARRYPPSVERIELRVGGRFDRSRPATVLYVVFALTVLGWVTEPLHGTPAAIVGFAAVVALTSSRVFSMDDVRRLNWPVLWLVAGGIALGNGVGATGLDAWFLDRLDWDGMAPALFVAAIGVVALVLSTVISNSATANLVAPIGLAVALTGLVDVEPVLVAVVIAIACSLAMALPVSTPPNAVAYASGQIASRDLAAVGLIVGAVGLGLTIVVGPTLWRLTGVL